MCNKAASALLEAEQSLGWEAQELLCTFRDARRSTSRQTFRQVMQSTTPLATDRFLFAQIEAKMVAPLHQKVISMIQGVVGSTMRTMTGLCGLIPVVGGLICAQIGGVVHVALPLLVPALASYASSVAWKRARDKIAAAAQDILGNFADAFVDSNGTVTTGSGLVARATARGVDPIAMACVQAAAPLLDQMLSTMAPVAWARMVQCDVYTMVSGEGARAGPDQEALPAAVASPAAKAAGTPVRRRPLPEFVPGNRDG